MRVPLLKARAEWSHVEWDIVRGGRLAVWFPREDPTQEDMCPSLQNGKAEIQALKYPFPSSLKVWKYFLAQKTV